MKILVGYTSIEGQTRKIAETIAATIEDRGDAAAIMNISGMAEFSLERPDAVILCAPIHAGRYPSPFGDFVHREKDWLNSLPSAFVSVSLTINSDRPEERTEAERYPQTMMSETGWTPLAVLNVAGALRFTEYDFFKRWMMKRVAEKEGIDPKPGQDIEFTDWPALKAFVTAFLDKAKEEE
jgi:menaquinone-dependent protoporphyrinogen oxidase